MQSYTQAAHRLQEELDDPDIVLGIDPDYPELCPRDDILRFLDKTEERRQSLSPHDLRMAVCQDFDFGCVDARTSFRRLESEKLFGGCEEFMKIFSAGVQALSQGRNGNV